MLSPNSGIIGFGHRVATSSSLIALDSSLMIESLLQVAALFLVDLPSAEGGAFASGTKSCVVTGCASLVRGPLVDGALGSSFPPAETFHVSSDTRTGEAWASLATNVLLQCLGPFLVLPLIVLHLQ